MENHNVGQKGGNCKGDSPKGQEDGRQDRGNCKGEMRRTNNMQKHTSRSKDSSGMATTAYEWDNNGREKNVRVNDSNRVADQITHIWDKDEEAATRKKRIGPSRDGGCKGHQPINVYRSGKVNNVRNRGQNAVHCFAKAWCR